MNKDHWNNIYASKATDAVSWYQNVPAVSLDIINSLPLEKSSPIIDIGGGASNLVDHLVKLGFSNLSLLDISESALSLSQKRLGDAGNSVHWIASDITQVHFKPKRFKLWHDRAVFHFLTKAEDRQAYIDRLQHSLQAEGFALIATFALDGPEKCSGLKIVRYSPESLSKALGDKFELVKSMKENHQTPAGNQQAFVYCLFKKRNIPLE